jgi:hypothetical protein
VSLRQWAAVAGFREVRFYAETMPAKGAKRFLREAARSVVHQYYRLQYFLDYISFVPTVLSPNLIAIATR